MNKQKALRLVIIIIKKIIISMYEICKKKEVKRLKE